jgi:hypothetical protein
MKERGVEERGVEGEGVEERGVESSMERRVRKESVKRRCERV